MNIKIIKVVSNNESLSGIENTYTNEFQSLYLWSKKVWKIRNIAINNMLKTVNTMFIAMENDTPLGFIFAQIFKNKYDDSFIEKFLKISPGDPITRIAQFLPMLRKVYGNYDDHPYFSKLRYFLVNPDLKGKGIGSVLFNSFKKSCGNEYQQWITNEHSDWMWYIHKNCTIVAAGDYSTITDLPIKMRCIMYLYSNDPKKQEKIKIANCFIDLPKDKLSIYKKCFDKDGSALLVKGANEKEKFTIGHKYIIPLNEFVEVIEKHYINKINDYENIKNLTPSQINWLKQYEKEGIVIYRLKRI
jgi:hypothetical protein